MTTPCNMPKTMYADYTMHVISQVKPLNLYRASIYMYERLILGLYIPYICICNDLEAYTQCRADIYIYIYIYIYIFIHIHA